MRELAELLRDILDQGVMTSYALFGATARMRYTEEAMREAQVADLHGVPIRVVRPDHLGVIALDTGRPKDSARILALLDSRSVRPVELERLAARHGLATAWDRFRRGVLDP